MNATEARNWAKHLKAEFPSHSFAAVELSCPVYQCPVDGRTKKLHTEGRWGVAMNGVPYAYPPRP